MQRIAFIPDGLNEFLYAPNGVAECSTSQPKFITPVPLGAPDIEGSGPSDPSLRMDRELGSIGRAGTTGTIAELGAFAVAIPPYTRYQNDVTWLKKELVAVGAQRKGLEYRGRSRAVSAALKTGAYSGSSPDDCRPHTL